MALEQHSFHETIRRTSFKCPLVLTANFLLLLRCKVILDVKGLPNFLWSLSLDHVCNSLACQVQQALDVQIVGRLQNTIEWQSYWLALIPHTTWAILREDISFLHQIRKSQSTGYKSENITVRFNCRTYHVSQKTEYKTI